MTLTRTEHETGHSRQLTPVRFMTPGAKVGRAFVMLLALACGNCSKDSLPTGPTGTPASGRETGTPVSSFLASVTGFDGTSGVLRTGTVTAASPGGPTVQASGNGNVINGGANQIRLRSSAPFQTVYAFVNDVPGGVTGYWELRLAAPTTDTSVIVGLSRSIQANAFTANFAVAASSGAPGAASSLRLGVLPAATGDVQVSVSWDSASDVDLHVVEPSGEEIYYAAPTSRTAGALDLDSNAGCGIDNKNNENIRWPAGRAPGGNYTVRVNYWSSCGVTATNYVVTVNNGGSTQTFRGTFTGPGDRGGAGSGLTVATFTRAGGVSVGFDAPLDWQPMAVALSESARRKLETSMQHLALRRP